MEEKSLRNIAICCSIFGLVAIFFVSERLELQKTGIGEISIGDLGKNVRVCGTIDSRFVSDNGHIFLRLSDGTDSINIVVFSDTVKNLERYKIDVHELEKGGSICVIGYIDEYKDEMEIIGKKISVN